MTHNTELDLIVKVSQIFTDTYGSGSLPDAFLVKTVIWERFENIHQQHTLQENCNCFQSTVNILAVSCAFDIFESRDRWSVGDKCGTGPSAMKFNENDSACDLNSKTLRRDWNDRVIDLLLQHNITQSLVVCLTTCRVVSFLSRKALLVAVNNNIININDLLHLIENELIEKVESKTFPFLLEFLSDCLSSSLDTLCVRETYNWLQSKKVKEILHKYTEKFDSGNERDYFLWLKLVTRIIKFDFKENKFISIKRRDLINDFTISKMQSCILSRLVFVKFVKLLNVIVDKEFVFSATKAPVCIIEFAKDVSNYSYEALHIFKAKNFFMDSSFIGEGLAGNEENKFIRSSSYRMFALVVLKSLAILVKENKIDVLKPLMELYLEVHSATVGKNDWLTTLFAVQDDQWIIALLSLLVVHIKSRKGLTNPVNIFETIFQYQRTDETLHPFQEAKKSFQESTLNNSNTSDNSDILTNNDFYPSDLSVQSGDLLLFCLEISPHFLFLQLCKYINFDHLILTDFLISPETEFLTYFLQYLRVLLSDCNDFINKPSSSSEIYQDTDETVKEKQYSMTSFKLSIENEQELIQKDNKENLFSNKIDTRNGASSVNHQNLTLVDYSDSEPSDSEICDQTDQKYLQYLENVNAANAPNEWVDEVTNSRQNKTKFHKPDTNYFQNIIEMFMTLKDHIERLDSKQLFPYNSKPLLKLLYQFENYVNI